MRAAKRAGRYTGRAPRGYKNSRDEFNKPALIKSNEAPFINYAFKEFAKGLKTQVEILTELEKKGVVIKKNTFSLLLRNTLYISKLHLPATDKEPALIVDAKHEPLVSESTFIKVQELLSEGKSKSKHPQYNTKREELPLRGFLKCRVCEHTMTGSASRSRNGSRHFYYHCNKCRKTRHKAELVNDAVQGLLTKLTVKTEVQKLYKEIVKIVYENEIKDNKLDESKAIKELTKLRTKSEKLNDLFFDGNIQL